MIGQFSTFEFANANFGGGNPQILNFIAGNVITCVGDPSNHGGQVSNSGGNTSVYCNGILVAVQGATHSCPIIGHGNTPISTIITQRFVDGKLVLVFGSQAGCGALIQSPASRRVFLN